ncbi:hypothetical protein Trco_005397 [Trichoderma cornu-damae]|uniref:Uncharacterized protein n=1 Tax=Trichoderma cornu-damae TaxID=654480 RepID=A0A9P8TV66_9HYPO|nr:hypothetical protein Trco_005397 [Trichoderma cornu-damae]
MGDCPGADVMVFSCVDTVEEVVRGEGKAEDSEGAATATALKICGPWTDSSVGWAADDTLEKFEKKKKEEEEEEEEEEGEGEEGKEKKKKKKEKEKKKKKKKKEKKKKKKKKKEKKKEKPEEKPEE